MAKGKSLRADQLWTYPPGKHFDNGRHGQAGLYLLVKPGDRSPTSRQHNQPSPGRRSWVVRLTRNGRREELGVGSLRDLTLQQARDDARALRKQARDGVDPRKTRAERRAKRTTFAAVA